MKSKDDFYRQSLVFVLALVIVSMVMIIYLGPAYKFVRNRVTTSNIIPYIFMSITFVLLLCIGLRNNTSRIFDCWEVFIQKQYSKSVAILILLGIVLSLWGSYVVSPLVLAAYPKDWMMYHVNHNLIGIFLGAISCIVFALPIPTKILLTNLSGKLFCISVCGLGFLFAYTMYQPNIFTTFHNFHHADAYFHSIYNVLCNYPFDHDNFSVYGYYAIIITPFIRIMGITFRDCTLLLSFLGYISYLCLTYTLCRLVGSNLLAFLGCVLMLVPAVSMDFGVYYQSNPHRYLWDAILLCYLVKNNSRLDFKRLDFLLGSLIVIFSLVWNLETGLVTLLTWYMFRVYKHLQKSVSLQYIATHLLIEAVVVITIFFAAWILVSSYNIFCLNGELISLRQFIFPFGETGNSYLHAILTDYQRHIMLWMIIAILCFVTLSYCISKTCINRCFDTNTISNTDAICFSLTVLVLLKMSYYINRQVPGNLNMVIPYAVVLLCFVIKRAIIRYQKEFFLSVRMFLCGIVRIGLIAIIAFIFAGIANFGTCEYVRIKEKTRDFKRISEVENIIEKTIPTNTKFIGASANIIYWDLKRDGSYHFLDFADIGIRPHLCTSLLDELNNKLNEAILIDSLNLRELKKYGSLQKFENRFIKMKEFNLGITTVLYFVPK